MNKLTSILNALLLAPLAALQADDLPLPDGIENVRVERSDSDQ